MRSDARARLSTGCIVPGMGGGGYSNCPGRGSCRDLGSAHSHPHTALGTGEHQQRGGKGKWQAPELAGGTPYSEADS